jgi:RimJ/RimL family protein N-acetyltransferase
VPATSPTGDPLIGRTVRLDRMVPGDAEGLHAVFGDPANYADGYVMHAPSGELADTEQIVATRCAIGNGHVAYTARLVAGGPLGPAGTVVGTSSIGDVDLQNERTHIGWTMWGRRWWGSAVNPEAKLLMLGHCFDDCGFGRVKIQTDALNHHSQAAIAKLGAQREGVLRRHTRRADGSYRDTVVFSILRDEWPRVKAGLEARLESPPPAPPGR